ncbi:tyrosine-type recombinase/integrase [Actinomadura macra]|uniref:tyrosine-type recombinase/integrase n=1 Tax=Actinomadura macra TaxID=46164 RepID=UPI00083296DD|nr:site-specific integrase [Actinomadura macra]
MAGKRRFGRVRQLPSGRWQARYPGPDGRDHNAPHTFPRKKDAEQWLTLKEADLKRGDWFDPAAGAIPFAVYAADWVEERELSPKTVQLYELLLRLHLNPTFGETHISDVRLEDVRRWRASRLKAGPKSKPSFGPVTVAKAYRLLRAVLNTAVQDKRIKENPCQIPGADRESSPERPVLSVAEVFRIAEAIAPRYRALVLLATFGNLRWGELAGLRRKNLDLDAATVRVDETVYELGPLVKGTPKSEASRRKVVIPDLIIPDLRRHLNEYAQPGSAGFVFVGVRGGQLRRSNFSKPWARALEKAELEVGEIHVHDLRHTGNTFAAESGASLAEMMSRMGHSSTRAAQVYLHARRERDREIASTLGKMAARELKKAKKAEKRRKGPGGSGETSGT